jgi:acyl-homoserine lactone acylase PvdQ
MKQIRVWTKWRTLACATCLFITISSAQASSGAAQAATNDLPPSAQLLENNEDFRVQRLDIQETTKVSLPQLSMDTVFVVLGDGLSLSTPTLKEPEQLADGDVRFLAKGKAPSFFHQNHNDSALVVIGIKHHWDAEVTPCQAPKVCTHAIRADRSQIGQSTTLFTNGFLTAYRHRMDHGGTLSTSYYSSRGKHHLMFVALEDLHANFDGTDQDLKRGQVFGTDAADIEVDAGKRNIAWAVIRIEMPKD